MILAAVGLLLALPLVYLDRNVLEAGGFADNAAAAASRDAVRERLARELTSELVAREPRLVAVAPVLGQVLDGVLASPTASSLVRAAAVETHNALFSQTEGSVVIDLANVGVVALGVVESRDPALASQLQQPKELAIELADRTLTVDLVRVADRVRVLALVLPLLALVLFAAGMWLAPSRRRAVLGAGLVIFLAGMLSLAGFTVVRAVSLSGRQGEEREVAAGVFDAFLGRYSWWCIGLALVGAILAASATSLERELQPSRLPSLVWAATTVAPRSKLAAVVGAFVLIAVGAMVIAEPLGVMRLTAVVFGSYLVFAGVVALLRLLAGPEPSEEEALSIRILRRRYLPWLVGGVALVGGASALVGLVIDGRASTAPAAAASSPGCNGSTMLCSRRFDEVVFPASHNAMSSAQALFLNANHGIDLQAQLEIGIRGLLLDAYEGQRNTKGYVHAELAPKAVEEAEAQIGREGLAAAKRLAASRTGPVEGPKKLYFCHVLCELGALDAVDALREVRDWMDRHPREVLVIVVEDAAPTAAIKASFEQAGLAELASDFQPAAGRPFPTLGEMIHSGKRLWVMAEEHGDASGWYHQAYKVTQETPYSFKSPAQLQTDGSCRPSRGGTTPPLFLVNSWVATYPPNPRNADVVNQRAFLVERARRCERLRERTANLLAVDFAERGDVVGAAAKLNELTRGSP
jgi:hypothetical protein